MSLFRRVVKIIFSKNKLIGSKIIQKATREKHNLEDHVNVPSHVAFLFYNFWLVEASFPFGFRVRPYTVFLDDNEIVDQIELEVPDQRSKMIEVVTKFWGWGYDYMGVIYQGLSILNYLVFKGKLANSNPWDRKNRVSCQEIISVYTGKDYSSSTPYDLLSKFKSREQLC